MDLDNQIDELMEAGPPVIRLQEWVDIDEDHPLLRVPEYITVSKLSEIALTKLICMAMNKLSPDMDEETSKGIVEHYRPVREVIQKIHQFDNYERISSKIVNNEKDIYIEAAKFLLWQCFENFEAKSLSFLSKLYVFDNKILELGSDGKKFFAVTKCKDLYLNCESLSFNLTTLPFIPNSSVESRKEILWTYGVSENTLEHPVDKVAHFFEKLPNLKDIRIDICIKDLCSELMMEIVPKYPSLKKLQLALYCEKEAESFCKLTEQNLRNLEILNLEFFRPDIQIRTLETTLKFLNNLPKLSTFNAFVKYPFIWPENENNPQDVSEKDQVKQVKQTALQNPTLEELSVYHNWLTNLKSLSISLYRRRDLHWSDESLAMLNLQHFKTIQCLEFDSVNQEVFPINIPILLKHFPNLEVFVTCNFECHDGDEINELLEMKSLQRLIVTKGNVYPPKLLKKFPNLVHFRMKWPKNPSRKLEAVNAVKPFLPSHCKLFEAVSNNHSENIEKEIVLQ